MQKKEIEDITKRVYGDTFRQYNKEEFLAFLKPLSIRLARNGIPESVFQGVNCLDAGCGGGRATVLMARAGAKEVLAFDLSEENIKTTRKNAALFGLQNVSFQTGSLLELPFENETFDVVWSNGVLHHTVDPDRALREICRVLKKGGHLWLYLYGSGGIYWFLVDFLRGWLADLSVEQAISALVSLKTPTGRVAEFIDDWLVPELRRYIDDDVQRRLHALGFQEVRYLKSGMSYDTSERRGNETENLWMGGGDLRYWARKTDDANGESHFILPNKDGKGSEFEDPTCVTDFAADFKSLADRVKIEHRVRVASQLQTWLRDRMTAPEPFSGDEFREFISRLP